MKKYLILDMGKVLVEPTTGHWLITPTFLANVDKERLNQDKLKIALDKSSSILDGKAVNLNDEYVIMENYYKSVFKEVEYDISKEKLDNIVRDFVYNENDNKYYLYDDVSEELNRLSKKYTLLMLSDNWPCGEEYLKKYDIINILQRYIFRLFMQLERVKKYFLIIQ